ncbi:uncharacterized protein N7498_003392 [Penicillium cinerascens]|uniref:Uncharacterized protein n=1 Tax=Penicillium cinerascens TaxID=70096 RepID=A0A9W9T737_9EURO|nr:uncharacterized protein N7498_003392 [Penicillium cinerascens]KAJ5211746.1 hypothetical protein N7498_003392 [Penicillium cinerascens]
MTPQHQNGQGRWARANDPLVLETDRPRQMVGRGGPPPIASLLPRSFTASGALWVENKVGDSDRD